MCWYLAEGTIQKDFRKGRVSAAPPGTFFIAVWSLNRSLKDQRARGTQWSCLITLFNSGVRLAAAARLAEEGSRITAGHLGPYLEAVKLPDNFWMAQTHYVGKATENIIALTYPVCKRETGRERERGGLRPAASWKSPICRWWADLSRGAATDPPTQERRAPT